MMRKAASIGNYKAKEYLKERGLLTGSLANLAKAKEVQ